MAYYFINTDAKSLGGESPHDKWINYEYAFTGGTIAYGKQLGRFLPGDICLMYASRIGVVAVGKVLSTWDGITYQNPLVYTGPHKAEEYRICVDWFRDLRDKPIKCDRLRLVLGWNPSRAVQRIKKDEAKIDKLIKAICGNSYATEGGFIHKNESA
ncbi:MAG: hypothetical protein ABSB22_17585 [Thermodesulfobacteriota bacterium]